MKNQPDRTKRRFRRFICHAVQAVACLTGFIVVNQVHAQDWPQWRGENREGTLQTEGLVDDLSTLKPAWEQPIGSGYSGPTVANGLVYVMDRDTSNDQQLERVVCFHEKTGELAWSHSYEAEYQNVGYVAGPRASVTCDGEKV